jgi:hypothetical protein
LLSEQAISEFKEIYQKEFGEELSDDEARRKAENLFGLFKVIYWPMIVGDEEWHA